MHTGTECGEIGAPINWESNGSPNETNFVFGPGTCQIQYGPIFCIASGAWDEHMLDFVFVRTPEIV